MLLSLRRKKEQILQAKKEQNITIAMAIQNNPTATLCRCYAVLGRERVLRLDGAPLTLDDLHQIAASTDMEGSDLFEERETGICVLGMTTREGLSEGYAMRSIRESFAVEEEAEVLRLSRAKALAEWRRMTRYCGTCGTVLEEHPTLTARQCPHCGRLIFPRIEPCIITIVSREDGKILLAKHVQRNQNIYACIAGFIEAGESVEHAVAREVREETGLEVCDIRYFGSQSWPFPSQLMLGFTCRMAGGTLKLQADEIAEARWFDRDNCPLSPAPGSIAWRLIHNS